MQIRILHHLARSGGTLISKCIGCMDGIILLSEIHPHGLRYINPLGQAVKWHGLITQRDINKLATRKGAGFTEAIELIAKAAGTRGKTLVIRDWSHIDFMAVPYVPQPSNTSLLADILSERFDVVSTSTVRHPLDQWLSLRGLEQLKGLELDPYLAGCRHFAEWCQKSDFIRYEDFTADPDAHLATLCERLRIGFDSTYSNRWASFTNVTGDVKGSRGGTSEIKPVPRRKPPPELIERLNDNQDYRRTLELLGYDD